MGSSPPPHFPVNHRHAIREKWRYNYHEASDATQLVSARILHLFDTTSSRTLRWKPNILHANRGTFYAVAKGVGNGEEGHKIPIILEVLKTLWVSLTFGGEEGLGRHMVPEDLEFLISMDDLVNHRLDWLTKFGTPLWKVQKTALEKFYEGKHIK